ncbi:MAG: hypothetical protein ACM37W_24840 [Actinomycetota bacterium]
MLNQLLERLACLEDLEPNLRVEAETIYLIETITSLPEGLQILVEKYSASPCTLIVRLISCILAVKASSTQIEITPFLLIFIENLRDYKDEQTLINCLTALQRRLIFNPAQNQLENLPPFLSDFLMTCLNQSIPVKRVTISVIGRIYERNLMSQVFDEPEIASLREELSTLSQLGDPQLDREINRLTDRGEIVLLPRTGLTGSALLEKAKELSHLSSRALAKQCGYYTLNKNNLIRANLSEFYREMRKAKRLYPEFKASQNGHQAELNGKDAVSAGDRAQKQSREPSET